MFEAARAQEPIAWPCVAEHAPVDDDAWFAIWTRSRHEQVVTGELASKGIEAFVPTVVRVSQWTDRTKRIAWPLFPGYCFARFDASQLGTVLRCTGVVSVLSNDRTPIPVPATEIEALQRLVASGLPFDASPLFAAGTKVRVIRGPLAGVVGRLVRAGAHEQLLLAVDLLNGGARVHVAAADVAAL